MWFLLGVLLAFLAFVAGFIFAIVCYPDKQEIIDKIKRDRA